MDHTLKIINPKISRDLTSKIYKPYDYLKKLGDNLLACSPKPEKELISIHKSDRGKTLEIYENGSNKTMVC
jgi:hypothetical protein